MTTRLRVLIVEDRPADAELMLHELRRAGFEPAWERVETEADYLAQLDPALDLILADLNLPQFDGLRALHLLQERGLDIPFIVVTGSVEEAALECMKQGAADYLLKDRLSRLGLAVTQALVQKQIRDDRARAVEALRESESFTKKVLESSLAGTYIYDLEKKNHVYINRQYTRLTGYTQEDLNAMDGAEFVGLRHPDDQSRFSAHFERIAQARDGDILEIEYRFRAAGGGWMWCLSWDRVFERDDEGNLLQTIGTFLDITERKRAESQRDASLEALAAERTLLRTLIDNLPDYIYVKDTESRFVAANEAVACVMGATSPDDLLGKTDFDFYPKELATRYQVDDQEVVESGQPLLNKEEPGTDPEGNRLHLLSTKVPLRDQPGNIVGLVGIGRDVTEYKQAEERILRQSAVLDAINRVFREALTCETDEQVARVGLAVAEELTGSKFGLVGEVNQAGLFDTIAISNPGWDACKMPDSEAAKLIKNMEIRGVDRSTLREEESRIVNDPGSHPDSVGIPEGHPPVTSFLGVPLKHGGRTIGMIALANKESGYDLTDQQAVESLSVAFVEALQRKRAEEKLRESELWMRNVFSSLEEAVLVLTPHRVLVSMNAATQRMFGYSEDELVTLSTEVLHADHEHYLEFGRRIEEAFDKGEAADFEFELRRKDGGVFPTEHTVSLLKNDVGEPIGMVSVVRDITERVQAAEEIRRRNRELELLNQVIAASASSLEPEEILETACRQLALTFDLPQAAAALLNEEKTEAAVVAEYRAEGRPSGLGETIPVEDNPSFQYLLEHKAPLAVDDAQSDPRLAPVHDLMRQCGIVSLLILPLVIGEDLVGSLGLDATEPRPFSPEETDLAQRVVDQVSGALARIRSEEERRRLEEQYSQAQRMEAVGQLTAGIAHDFNNLLTAINGFAQLMQMRLAPDSPFQDMAGKILSAGQRAADLVSQLMAFSRKQVLELKVLDLNQVVDQMHEMLRRIIREDIELETIPGPDLWPVAVDPSKMEQVIVNLAVNAGDAMPDGGRLLIETANVVLDEGYVFRHPVVQPGDYVLLAMTDTGVGMSEEVQAHVFEPFFTTKERGSGTGLGLATVYGVVKQSGGYIWVYSEEGLGSSFKIYLPRAHEAAEALSHPEVSDEMPFGEETILLVEDEAAVRELAAFVLQEQGYNVLEAANGQEALELAARHDGPIDLLIADIVMPGMGGKELAPRLAATHSQAKTLFVSGYTPNSVAPGGALELGGAFLQKPFSTGALARKVRDVLDAR